MTEALYIGLMSGTSTDAIDGVLVNFEVGAPEIIATHLHAIPDDIRRAVFTLTLPGDDEINKLRVIDRKLGVLFGDTVSSLCHKAEVDPVRVKAIGSHGQTVRHVPRSNHQPAWSMQVGDPNIIAEKTGITTVADFRRRDIAAGGQGAPLAPGLHNHLLRSTTVDRIILNAGGIANITHLPKDGPATGFDTGPANALLDAWCQLHCDEPCDLGGRWALSGQVNSSLLEKFLVHPYFALSAPKSTGREDFNLSWVRQILTDFAQSNAIGKDVDEGEIIAPADVQATLLALSVESIARSIESVDPNAVAAIHICGGGAHNTVLCQQLAERLIPRTFASTTVLGIDPDWVEAVAFAWLARQTMERRAGNLPEVTGARREVVLGGIYLG